ncbi:hypothetical protein PUN28_001000 [Cardiocondyla obscurior]|uniref:Uncharacterized protein n=1 Tax=Cardiocondyla obscurior TaxID=286306 RepID=A0AAW2H2T1_9HYME
MEHPVYILYSLFIFKINDLHIINKNTVDEINSLEYPGKFLVYIAIDNHRQGFKKIVETDNTIAVSVDTVKHDLCVFSRITKWK